MLFDTPLLDVPAASTSQNPASGKETAAQKGAPGNKRRRSSTGGDVAPAPDALADAAGPAFNVDKLLKKMHQAGSAPRDGKSPVAANKAPQQPQDGPSKKRQKGAAAEKPPARADVPKEKAVQATLAGEGKRAKKAKNKEKKAGAGGAAPNGAGEAVSAQMPVSLTSQSSQQDTPRGKHAAPAQIVVGSSATASAKKGSVQDKLRAQLAGGKFRMLNEQLYTTSGDDAHRLMKEDAAFDDYHIGFRSQAATWPVHPLALIAQSLLQDLAPNSLVADFGCGDAALARTLCPPSASVPASTTSQLPPIPSLKVPAKAVKAKQLKVVSFDLVSQSSYVVEAECSSVPLPGGTAGGEIVDAVVCCLSLMGTDWIRMIREASRVLREGGTLKIAEVSSRFTSFDEFGKLVKELGFSLANKDESNTHFVLFDFVKQQGPDALENPTKVAEHDRKAATLLNPCIYKRR